MIVCLYLVDIFAQTYAFLSVAKAFGMANND